ncbi:MAG TPA: aminomethyltransferase family protein [Blastocatellia bacterium]|nr:aminomethyltransferase family protein [Blastocatellia bacterium]
MTEANQAQNKRTPLHEVQQAAGATFGEWLGWEMPAVFSDVRAEHSAVRSDAGLIDLSYCGVIGIGGSEAPQFLNGLITNDAKTVGRANGVLAGFLTEHGKVKALCAMLGLGDGYLIVNEPQTHEKVFNYVFPFSYAGDFKVEDVSARHRILSVQGPKARNVLKEACFEPLPDLAELHWTSSTIAGQQVIVVRRSRTGEDGYDLLIPEGVLRDVWEFILLKGGFHSIRAVGHEAFEVLRIEAGQLVYGADVDENNMMLETGLSEAVSFTKGCYKGQEAVAMATYRGHVSKSISGLTLESDVLPRHGDRVLSDGKPIGHVTSSTRSYSLGRTIALAYLKYGAFDVGTEVEIDSEQSRLPATVVSLPFYKA